MKWPDWVRRLVDGRQPLTVQAAEWLRGWLLHHRDARRINEAEYRHYDGMLRAGQRLDQGTVGWLRGLRDPREERQAGVPDAAPERSPTMPVEAAQIIREAFDAWGLGSEAGWAFDQLRKGVSLTEILAEVKNRPLYQRMYGEVHSLRRNAGLPPLTEAQIMQERARYRAKLRQYGHDTSRYDDARDFNSLFAQDIDADEFGDRLELDFLVRNEAGPKLRALYEQRLGVKLEDKDVYELLSGQRPDLTPKEVLDAQYAEGAAPTFQFNPAMPIRELLKSFKQAQQERAADFLGDGSSFVLDEQTFG